MALLSRPHTLPSNAQLSALLDGVDELLVLFDARQRVSFCNQAAQRLLGCEPGQLADAALALLEPDARTALLAAWQPGSPAAALTVTALLGERDEASTLALTVSPLAGGARVLRAPLRPPALPQPRLAPGATSDLVQLLWDSPLPLVVQDRAFRVVAANRACVETFGLLPAQIIGQDPIILVPEPDRPAQLAARQALLEVLDTGAPLPHPIESRMVDAQGRERWFRLMPRWVSADDGAPLALVLMQDVTLEHQARQGAERQGHELDQWFDLSPIGMLVYDSTGLVLRSNGAFEALAGCAPVLLHDAPEDVCQLLAWEGEAPHGALRIDAPALEVRATVALPDGRRQRLRSRLRAFLGENGPQRVMAVVEDRSLEDEHDLAKLEIATLMDTAGMGVATYEASRGWSKSRPPRGAAASAAVPENAPSGLPGALQAIGSDEVEPESREAFDQLQRALRDGQRVQVRYAVNLPELGRRWLLTRVEPGELTGGRRALSVVTLDVTEQEEAHRRSDQLLRELSTILDATSAGIAYLRGERLVRCNRRFEAMLGRPAGQAAGVAMGELLADQPEALAVLRRALTEEGRHETELSRPLPGGLGAVLADTQGGPPAGAVLQWLSLSASRATAGGTSAAGSTADGAEPELVVVLTDVSRLKAQQAELEMLVRERELMFSLSDVGLAYLRHGRIERANAALAQLTGYALDELAQMHPAALFEDHSAYAAQWPLQQQAIATTGHWRGERRLRRRDGRQLWVQVSKRRVEDSGPLAGLICSYVDVDERHRAREALQLQAERTRAILDSVLVGIVTVGDGGIEWMNRSARRMFGGELADFVGEPIATVATADLDHPLRATHYLHALGDGQAETFECKLRGRDGREFWVVGNAVVTGRGEAPGGPGRADGPGTAGRGASQITFALLDIERRRQAEVSIAQAQASLQRIIDTAPLAIALFDASTGRVLRLNHMAATFFGRPMEAVLGRPPEQWFSAEEALALRADLNAAMAQTEVLRRELPRPAGSGVPVGPGAHAADGGDAEWRVWDMRVVSLDNPAGGSPGEHHLLLVASDVTEHRAAEQARFEAAVSQREMLIKEVHHRIKNNLQGVAGLLQQTAARRPEVAGLIGEAVSQVQAIAQVHGLQVGVSGPLRVQPLVEAITASVQRTFGRPITVQVDGLAPERFALPEGESIPVALTINELLTNAIKHSTPGDIRCVLQCDEARLSVAIVNPGQLREGFSLAQVPPGVSGLGLVRALLPRRTATLTLLQVGVMVEAKVVLVPPSITLLAPV